MDLIPAVSSVVDGVGFDLGAAQRRCHQLVLPALHHQLTSLHPSMTRMAEYAHGLVDETGGRVEAGAGKGIRPLLALMSARGAGAPEEVGIPGAVAVELIHNFSLVHDDIMDNDAVRRHRPATWTLFGAGPAILAGDAMHALAVQVLLDTESASAPRAVTHLNEVLLQLVFGQAQDLEFEGRPWVGPRCVTLREYRTMAGHKTGALLGCASAIGAILAGAPREVTDELHLAGHHLGLAFQVIDDVLGIWGASDVTGKPSCSDLRQRKKTFPILFALGQGGPNARRLQDLIDGDDIGAGDADAIARAVALIDDAGGLRASLEEARTQHATAANHLAGANIEPSVELELLALAADLLGREA